MPPALRVLPLAFLAAIGHAQSEPLPPIFAPRREPSRPAATAPVSRPPVSDRVRSLLGHQSERVLAQARPFELPAIGASSRNDGPAMDGGTVYLPRYLVTERALRDEDLIVRPPPIQLGSLTFERLERMGDARMISGWTMNLLRFGANRELNLNLIQASGRGADHHRDFIRGEIEFRIKF